LTVVVFTCSDPWPTFAWRWWGRCRRGLRWRRYWSRPWSVRCLPLWRDGGPEGADPERGVFGIFRGNCFCFKNKLF